jgi:hypothetical protein
MPPLTRKYLEWRVKRDFGEENFEAAMELLDTYGLRKHETSEALMRLACVVMAEGDMDQLRIAVEKAKADFRDVIAPLQARYGMHWQKHV